MKRMCRVYGRDFASRRVDAITCTPTCRQRLSRGQAFAYLAGLSKREQKVHREMHAGYDRLIASVKRRNAFLKDLRAEKRAEKQERERQRQLPQTFADIGFQYVREPQLEQQRWLRIAVTGAIPFLVKEQRNDISAEVIFELILEASPRRRQDLTIEQVAKMLDELHASGDYDRIVAEATTTACAACRNP